jgi:NAD(P)H dehydrogenase (quinone)
LTGGSFDHSRCCVYHSGYGHTARQAEAVKKGVEEVAGAEALLLTVEEAQARWDELAAADAIVFGAPTYVAGASARSRRSRKRPRIRS